MNVGGAERMCLNISYALDENKIDNAIICTRVKGALGGKASVPVYVLNKTNLIDILAFVRLIKRVKSFRPTHLHLHSTSLYWGVFAKMFFPKVKLIWHDHYGDSEMLSERPYLIAKQLVKLVDNTIVVNEKLLKWGLITLNISSEKIHYLKNFPHVLLGTVERNYKKPEKVEIIQVANYREQKNHNFAIDAAGVMASKKIDFNWIFFGVISDLSYYNTLTNRANSIGVSKYCNFKTANLSIENKLIANHIGVLTSKSEGLPVALLEYGLAGLIVICTEVGQCADVLGFGKYGYLVPPGNYSAFAETLEYIVLNWEEAIVKAKLFQDHIRVNYGSDAFIKKYLEIIAN